MTPEQEKVLLKVKKMLALANDSAASEGERDNALRMAHGLLARHNLSMLHVELGMAERVKDTIDAPEEWTITTVNAVASLFFCRHYYQRWRDKPGAPWYIRHSVIGKPANVATALLMADYVIGSIRRESTGHKDRAFAASFCTGASRVIATRCAELVKSGKPEGEATPGTAVVLADYYKTEHAGNTEWIAARTKLKAGLVVANASSQAGYKAGKEFGQSINLNGQVSDKGDSVKLLANGGQSCSK